MGRRRRGKSQQGQFKNSTERACADALRYLQEKRFEIIRGGLHYVIGSSKYIDGKGCDFFVTLQALSLSYPDLRIEFELKSSKTGEKYHKRYYETPCLVLMESVVESVKETREVVLNFLQICKTKEPR